MTDADLHTDPSAWLHALALRQRVPSARWQGVQGLARRAAAAQGTLRTLLIGKLQTQVKHLAQAVPADQPVPTPAASAALSALAELNATTAAHRPTDPQHGGPQLRALQHQPRAWTTLRVARRLAEAQAALAQAHQPNGAPAPTFGPLHAQTLVPRALARLQALSPAYLQALLQQLDTLAALAPEAASGKAVVKPAAKASRSGSRR